MGTFNEYGCGPRCLLKLLADKNTPMSADEFLVQFSPRYPSWQDSDDDPKPGLTSIEMIFDIARELGLVSKPRIEGDYSEVIEAFTNETKSILVRSLIHLQTEVPNDHISLLTYIDTEHFEIWCPLQDGTDIVLPFPAEYWGKKRCSGLILA